MWGFYIPLVAQVHLLQNCWSVLDSSWNVMAHGDAREGKWRGNRRMEWVASTLHTTWEHGVSSITTADAHTSAASNRLNWRPPADLNGLVRFAPKDEIWFLRVCHHISTCLYLQSEVTVPWYYYLSKLVLFFTVTNHGDTWQHDTPIWLIGIVERYSLTLYCRTRKARPSVEREDADITENMCSVLISHSCNI